MRQVIALIIAMLAFAVIIPAVCAQATQSQAAPLLDPAQTQFSATPSIADFLRDDWLPIPFAPEIITSTDAKKKSTTQDINKTKKSNLTTATFSIQDFLNDAWVPQTFADTINTATNAKKGAALKQSGLAIEQFLDDSWTPATPIVAVSDATGYKKHVMG
jgi:putative cell wall-binding protein